MTCCGISVCSKGVESGKKKGEAAPSFEQKGQMRNDLIDVPIACAPPWP